MTEHDSQDNTPSADDDQVANSNAIDGPLEFGQAAENYIQSYQCIADWIRFADAKAAVVLTVNGALAGLLIPRLHDYLQKLPDPLGSRTYLVGACLVAFFIWALFLTLSGAYAFICILPFRTKNRHPANDACPHFHPAAIASHYGLEDVDEFVSDAMKGGMKQFEKEVLAAILIDSHISNVKYGSVTNSIKLFSISVVFGFVYLLLTQF